MLCKGTKADEPARMLTTQIGTESSNIEGSDPTAWKSMLIVHGRLYRCVTVICLLIKVIMFTDYCQH